MFGSVDTRAVHTNKDDLANADVYTSGLACTVQLCGTKVLQHDHHSSSSCGGGARALQP
jgi:hypothetical protein